VAGTETAKGHIGQNRREAIARASRVSSPNMTGKPLGQTTCLIAVKATSSIVTMAPVIVR
jgi:hypothetical protein